MQRRKFLQQSMALAGMFPLTRLHSLNTFNTTSFMDDVSSITIGTCKCTFLRDMQFKYLAKDFFMNANATELNSALNKYNIVEGIIPSPFIAMLVKQEGRTILVDTGVGFTEKPIEVRGKSYTFSGKLLQLLQQENVKKEDITDVIITHFHPDHIGGLSSGEGQLHFSNAQYHLAEDEWNYWHSSQSDAQPDQFKFFVEKNITPLKAHNLHLFKGDFVELVPGITAVKAYGHTPGQVALIIHSQKEHLLYISDAFLHPLHIEHLDWQTNYDLDFEQAKQSRIKLLELSYKENMLLNAFHFDFPGLGRVDKKNKSWMWNYNKV